MSMSQFLKDRGAHRTKTFTSWATVELSGHKGCGAVIECLVTFTQTPVVKCSSFCRVEDAFPDEGGERELVSIEPHIRVKCGDLKPMECPAWVAEMLVECIDLDELNASED